MCDHHCSPQNIFTLYVYTHITQLFHFQSSYLFVHQLKKSPQPRTSTSSSNRRRLSKAVWTLQFFKLRLICTCILFVLLFIYHHYSSFVLNAPSTTLVISGQDTVNGIDHLGCTTFNMLICAFDMP